GEVRPRHAAAGRDRCSRRVQVELPGSAGTHNDRPGEDLSRSPQYRVKKAGAHAPAVVNDEALGLGKWREVDSFLATGALDQRSYELRSGRVAVGVQYSPA